MADKISDPEKWAPKGATVLSSASSAFKGATARWNAYGSPSFSQAVTPTSAEEVAEVVRRKAPYIVICITDNQGRSKLLRHQASHFSPRAGVMAMAPPCPS